MSFHTSVTSVDLFTVDVSQLPICDLNLSFSCLNINVFKVLPVINLSMFFSGTYIGV